MSHIRSKNTAIEKLVLTKLRAKRLYFRRHYCKAPGNPDIALPKQKKAVFIDGDFWHGYKYDSFKKNAYPVYGGLKFEGNIKRDGKYMFKLRRKGWKVLRIWEHELDRNFDVHLRK